MGGFTPATARAVKSYVYALVDPRTGRTFYVGRGRGDRCFDHVAAAGAGGTEMPKGSEQAPAGAKGTASAAGGTDTDTRWHVVDPPPTGSDGPPPDGGSTAGAEGSAPDDHDDHPDDDGSRFPELDRIRAIAADGRGVRIDILRYGLDPKEARLAEAVARDALGLADVTDGRKFLAPQRVAAVALDTLLAEPVRIKRSHPMVLLRLTGGTDGDALSAAMATGPAGAGWRLGKRWADPTDPRAPRYALGVVDGVARAAWKITAWRPIARDRYKLVGDADGDLGRYLGRSVSAYQVASSPVNYVFCGPHWVNSAG